VTAELSKELKHYPKRGNARCFIFTWQYKIPGIRPIVQVFNYLSERRPAVSNAATAPRLSSSEANQWYRDH
jgi:hypothetical protein